MKLFRSFFIAMEINIIVNSNADKCFSIERNILPDIKENIIRDINQNNKYLKISTPTQ